MPNKKGYSAKGKKKTRASAARERSDDRKANINRQVAAKKFGEKSRGINEKGVEARTRGQTSARSTRKVTKSDIKKAVGKKKKR